MYSKSEQVIMDLRAVRNEYAGGSIADLPGEPHRGMQLWLEEALGAEAEATAFSLATGAAESLSVRIVLAKEISAEGVVFYTNGFSRKGRQLALNLHAAGVFFWPRLARQICFAGPVTRLAAAEADGYFATRPRESQIAAAVSSQSEPIASYEQLSEKFAAAKVQFEGREIPRPEAWGGYRLAPQRVEFWQGQPNRLHQRLLYERRDDGTFSRSWLQP